MAASIEEVAKLAQVSISTVSRVINHSEAVREDTRNRVQSAIQRLGYSPNPFARGLMIRRSEIVGLVLPDLHGEFYSEIIRGANRAARDRGFNLVVSSSRDAKDGESLLSAMQQRALFDGLAVMVSEITDDIQRVLAHFRTPFVVLDDDIDGVSHDSVLIDQTYGAKALARHLLESCGARRLIFVGGQSTNVDSRARLDAAKSVFSAAGLPLKKDDVFHLDYQFETAYELALARVKSWAGPGHAVFAANDEMAAGIVAAAQRLSVSVPSDLGVVGFDDTRIARMMRPPLTTVRIPMAQMGSTAIDLLCDRIEGAKRPTQKVSLRPELVVRASCGANSVDLP